VAGMTDAEAKRLPVQLKGPCWPRQISPPG
jgi:hypothetical protein